MACSIPRCEFNQGTSFLVQGKILRAVNALETIKATTERQRLENAFVHILGIDPPSKVKQTLVFLCSIFTTGNDGLYGSLSHPAHGAQSKTNRSLFVDPKFKNRLVHIRSQNRNPTVPRFFHVHRDRLDIAHVIGQHRRHVFSSVVRL